MGRENRIYARVLGEYRVHARNASVAIRVICTSLGETGLSSPIYAHLNNNKNAVRVLGALCAQQHIIGTSPFPKDVPGLH